MKSNMGLVFDLKVPIICSIDRLARQAAATKAISMPSHQLCPRWKKTKKRLSRMSRDICGKPLYPY